MSVPGWQTLPGEFPWPPPNGQVMSPMFTGAIDIRWDDPALLNTGPSTNTTAASAAITITGTPNTLTAATGTITITSAPVPPGTTITVDTVELTALAGSRAPGSDDFDGSLGTPALVAASLVEAINEGSLFGFGVVEASVVGNVVTVTALTEGAAGNDILLDTSGADILLSGDTLTGGSDADTIIIGITTLTAVMGARSVGGLDFSVGPTSMDTANSIAEAINDTNNQVAYVTAISNGNEVAIVASTAGSEGNAILLDTTSDAITLSGPSLAGGQGNPFACQGKSNSQWTIVGVNIYRSDNGERGPYIRLNRFPIGSLFYRDHTDNMLVQDEVVQWDGAWTSKGDATNNYRWSFRTYFCPIVKATETPLRGMNARLVATPANSPSDVTLKIDGQVVPVDDVFGPNGEITLLNQPSWDLARERSIPPVLPRADGTSEVTITYWYNRNQVQTDLDRTTQVFYRLTTVAIDTSSPSGYIETPLGYSPPLSVSHVESYDYIWREAVRRNAWILQQGGERVKLFKKKSSGIPCPCRMDERTFEWNQQPSNRCATCMGTGFVGAYDGPIDIIVAPDDADRRVSQTPNGRRLEHTYEVWTGPSPAITQRDFIVKQTGERYSIGAVRRPSSRGLPLQQHFNIAYLDEQDIRYRIPVSGITELPWPQTRPTDQNTPCDPNPPHPVGFDYQATTMETEKQNIPDEREQRGRTPVWENIQYLWPFFIVIDSLNLPLV